METSSVETRQCVPALEDALSRLLTNLLLWVQPNATVEPGFRGKQCLLCQVKYIRACGLEATYGAGSAKK